MIVNPVKFKSIISTKNKSDDITTGFLYPCIPTLIARIPRILIIPFIPFPDSPFRLSQIAGKHQCCSLFEYISHLFLLILLLALSKKMLAG